MTNKLHSFTLLVTSLVLAAFSSGCSHKTASQKATKLQPADYHKTAATLSNEAYVLIGQDDLQLAIAKAELAIEKDPNLGEAQKNLALAYCDSGRVEEALGPAQAAVSLLPDLDKAHYVLGKVLFRLERLDNAVAELQHAIRLNSKYDKAYFLLGACYDLMNKSNEARAALDKTVQLQPDAAEYRRFRDSIVGYRELAKNRAAIPKIVSVEGMPYEYAASVYSGILYEALVHHDFGLIERAADEARASKEKLPGGEWKLQFIYGGVSRPYWPTSDHEWRQHIELLQQWIKEKPDSITAKITLAACQNNFAWNARGERYAKDVSEENRKLFLERIESTKEILLSVRGQKTCPMWYSVMQQVALAEGWDRETYEKLFAESIEHEPTYYEHYRQKVMYLLPRWHGQPGELEAYVNSFAVNRDKPDSAILHFLLNQTVGDFEPNEADKPAPYYSVLKQGFLDLRKAYGVNQLDQYWIYHKAMATNDREFAHQLFTELKDNSNLPLSVDKQMFETAVKSFEKSKN